VLSGVSLSHGSIDCVPKLIEQMKKLLLLTYAGSTSKQARTAPSVALPHRMQECNPETVVIDTSGISGSPLPASYSDIFAPMLRASSRLLTALVLLLSVLIVWSYRGFRRGSFAVADKKYLRAQQLGSRARVSMWCVRASLLQSTKGP